MEVIQGHLYDYPQYYDVLFGSDWKAEYRFLLACAQLWLRRPLRSLFEPGCGTGRLLFRFAKAGYRIGGLDLNPAAVNYCRRRLQRHGCRAHVFVGNMAHFRLRQPVDMCYNMINTFRHLPDEETALSHLECVAHALKPGGLYVLGLHLTPQEAPRCTEESWSASRGHLCVNSRLWSLGIDLQSRVEHVGMQFDVFTPTRRFRIEERTTFRTYTAEQMRQLLNRIPVFDVLETYDFRYDIDWPIEINATTEDVVYVLRRSS